jgi:Bacterial low temperature requirement A protein (LtrA)
LGPGENIRVSEPASRHNVVARAHRLRRMSGRDPHEPHRVATPLELLFDLTFVIAFGVAASQLAHMLASGHVGAGLAGFSFATFAVSWAWIHFSWFASAYDTDDWVYRLTTMLQMVGVLVLALGIPQVFAAIAGGTHVDNRALVAGYVVMRVAMVIQWLRAARQNPDREAACLTYALTVTVAQIRLGGDRGRQHFAGCHLRAVRGDDRNRGDRPTARRKADGRNAVARASHRRAQRIADDHRARRRRGGHGCLVVCGGRRAGLVDGRRTRGGRRDRSDLRDVVGLFRGAGRHLLHAHRERSIGYGYLHIAVFGSIVATGAGLHAAADFIEHRSALTSVATVVAVAVPVGVYVGAVFGT